MLKKKSKRGYAYYACEQGAECGFMTWDVPTAEDCPKCGQSLYKKSGRGRMKPFCINEKCEAFLPEDKRGYYKKKTAAEGTEGEPAGEPAAEKKSEKKATKKTAGKTAAKKPAAGKKTTTRKTKKTEAAE
jgi:DNA topoisomerase-1